MRITMKVNRTGWLIELSFGSAAAKWLFRIFEFKFFCSLTNIEVLTLASHKLWLTQQSQSREAIAFTVVSIVRRHGVEVIDQVFTRDLIMMMRSLSWTMRNCTAFLESYDYWIFILYVDSVVDAGCTNVRNFPVWAMFDSGTIYQSVFVWNVLEYC